MNDKIAEEITKSKYIEPVYTTPVRPSIPNKPNIREPIYENPGIGTGNATISMSKTEIDNLIAKLNSAKEQMESIWDDIKNNDFQRITNSWAGKDCQAYMSKINHFRLTGSFEALVLLASTYKKASDKIEELQNENVNIIQSM